MATYVPGDRVWVYIEGDGWWPARVLSDEEMGTRTPGFDLAVQFYAGVEQPATLYELNSHADAANICFFETSSEKAVTGNPELEASIRCACADAEANPLKSASAIVGGARVAAGGSGAAGSAGAAAVNRAAVKRVRDMGDDDTGTYGGGAAASRSASGYHHLRSDELHELSSKISSAVAAADLTAVRAALCQLDGVDVYLTELEDTKIGVAVGSVLSQPALKPLWPLARAMISFWARHLPAETLAAIRSVQQRQLPVPAISAAAAAEPSSPHNKRQQPLPAVPSRSPFASSVSPSAATAAGGAVGGAAAGACSGDVAPTQRKTFYDNVYQLLDSPLSTTRYDDTVIDEVARKLATEITDRDERQMLLLRLREEELSFIRDHLLSGEWTPKKYLDQPNEVFTTKSEKARQEQRIQEKMKAIEAADNAMLNITSLFKCGRCSKRHCTFYEQQTRSADEPTTKYITCLDCKNTWTQE
ncbi:transcription elongation factor-like protein [Leishmania donovani]|uniref:Transcription elongation factor-like protein n=1 Tax=Leishmania donovani TaxID=5661 RepID=A0A3Q8IGU5_LEIDO|nr:transcription elongation factor-like protein [Leishmania donovani]AYU82277.1 transcription elongation factor-like protein [Leishmania donovani]TPP53586.1 Transcription factor S-II (TFIIS) family protein [Leishmania donovani]CBZ37437.1 transcription elongation factor-like protein [Leishmania donovani]